jgi:ABC-type nitrate/sulfonate/bicarbonate transport system permease component
MIVTSRNTVRIVADARKAPNLFERALHSELFIAIASPLLILLLWEIVVRIHLLDARFFPAPSSVIVELVLLAQ